MTVWFTSDLHIGHGKVAELRGYSSVEAHDSLVMDTLDEYVQDGDQLWILGDISGGSSTGETIALDQMEYFNLGRETKVPLHLVAGNHDSCHPMNRDSYKRQAYFLDSFDSVQAFARRKTTTGRCLLMSHFPYTGDRGPDRYTQYRLRDEGEWLLHGHTHSEKVYDRDRMLHVGWDAWGRPVSLEEISSYIESVEKELAR